MRGSKQSVRAVTPRSGRFYPNPWLRSPVVTGKLEKAEPTHEQETAEQSERPGVEAGAGERHALDAAASTIDLRAAGGHIA